MPPSSDAFGVQRPGADGNSQMLGVHSSQDSAGRGARRSLPPQPSPTVGRRRGRRQGGPARAQGGPVSEQTYDEGRAEELRRMLRELAARIGALDAGGDLLAHAGELMRLIGDVRSELFHYEVRCTYDSPEVAEHRRLVEEAKQQDDGNWEPTGWSPDDDEESEW